MDISIKKIGERHDEASGLSHHEHGVYEGDQQIGSAVVAVKDGRAAGLKVKGLKTKHMSPLMTHLKTTYGDQMAKAIVGSAMPVTGKKRGKKASEPDLDHDRRRIKSAIFTMLGKTEAPHSPDGKVNLAKSLAGRTQYNAMMPDLQSTTSDLLSREVTGHHHDHAAYMIAHAHKHMEYARQHMLQDKPTRADSVRNILGLKPLHMKHLEAAGTFIRAAKVFTAKGDQALYAAGKIDTLPESARATFKKDKKGRSTLEAAYKLPNAQAMIPLALREIRLMHNQNQAQQKAEESVAPPPPKGATPRRGRKKPTTND